MPSMLHTRHPMSTNRGTMLMTAALTVTLNTPAIGSTAPMEQRGISHCVPHSMFAFVHAVTGRTGVF